MDFYKLHELDRTTTKGGITLSLVQGTDETVKITMNGSEIVCKWREDVVFEHAGKTMIVQYSSRHIEHWGKKVTCYVFAVDAVKPV